MIRRPPAASQDIGAGLVHRQTDFMGEPALIQLLVAGTSTRQRQRAEQGCQPGPEASRASPSTPTTYSLPVGVGLLTSIAYNPQPQAEITSLNDLTDPRFGAGVASWATCDGGGQIMLSDGELAGRGRPGMRSRRAADRVQEAKDQARSAASTGNNDYGDDLVAGNVAHRPGLLRATSPSQSSPTTPT